MPFDGNPINIDYTPSRTCEAFMRSDTFFRLIAGPIGSGKTVTMIIELLRRSAMQRPWTDGFRYTRWAIVRQTLSQLKQTVLKDILQWLPFANWKVSDSTIYIEIGDIRTEWLLIPLEDIEDQRRLLSSQLTGAWVSEGIEIDFELLAPLSGRCGRYPGPNIGGCTWRGIIVDTNFPPENTPWQEHMENPPEDWEVFKQPGGLDDDAENLDWLEQTPETLGLPLGHPVRVAHGRKYYERAARNPNPAWVNRYVHAQYGIDPSGTPVFGETFKPRTPTGNPWHVVDYLDPVAGCTLLIGQDFGRDPCAVICQVDPIGRLLVLEEIVSLKMGLEKHILTKLRPALMQDRYLGKPTAVIGDPSGVAKSTLFEINNFDLLKKMGFHAFPAPTNDIDPRIRAVEFFLLQARGTGPALLIDRGRCPMMVQGLSQGYRFDLLKEGELKPRPRKNTYSHLADALQAACLSAQGGALGFINRRFERRPPRPAPPKGGWT